MFFIVILFIIILLIFYLINNNITKEYFCYGNVYCNGNKDNTLCINQMCSKCGLNPICSSDSDCVTNNCINGCCDGL